MGSRLHSQIPGVKTVGAVTKMEDVLPCLHHLLLSGDCPSCPNGSLLYVKAGGSSSLLRSLCCLVPFLGRWHSSGNGPYFFVPVMLTANSTSHLLLPGAPPPQSLVLASLRHVKKALYGHCWRPHVLQKLLDFYRISGKGKRRGVSSNWECFCLGHY